MSIYMKIEGVKGSVTAAGYEDAMSILKLEEAANSYASSLIPGHSQSRSISHPQHQEICLIKKVDNSSIKLYDMLHKAQTFPEVIIDFVRPGNNSAQSYLQYTLSDVLITGIRTMTTPQYERPIEILRLNYTKIQKRFTPTQADLTPGAPSAALYDLATGMNSGE